jgi:hypothetical protein
MATVMNDVATRTRGVIADLKQRDFATDRYLLDDHGNVKPVFYLVKVKDTISRFDTDKGESTQTDQYLIYLELDIDETKLEVQYEERERLGRGARAVGVLAPETKAIEAGRTFDVTPEKKPEGEPGPTPAPETPAPEKQPEKAAEPPMAAPASSQAETKEESSSPGRTPQKAQLVAIKAMALKYGVEEKDIDKYFETLDYDGAVKAITALNSGDYGFFTKAAA